MESSSPIHYAAHTAICTFLLDSEGICRKVVMAPSVAANPRARETARAATRCIGAQYVASLDAQAAGLLTDTPKVGTSMLFARTDEKGRISLVRTGQVTRFERQELEDPFVEQDRPSVVATSAPPLSPSMVPTPRRASMLPPPDPYADDERMDDRTLPVHAVRPASYIRELRPVANAGPTSEPPTMRNPLVPAREPSQNSTNASWSTPPPRRSDVAPRPAVAGHRPAIRRRG